MADDLEWVFSFPDPTPLTVRDNLALTPTSGRLRATRRGGWANGWNRDQ